MMPALSIFFCWLLSRSGGNDSKRRIPHAPSISVSPSWRVLEGSDVIIHCESPYPWGVMFSLWKGSHNTNFVADVDGGKANFSINPVNRDDGGLYSCSYYYSISKSSSEHSEPLELLITDPQLPQPAITLSSSEVSLLGNPITIQCLMNNPSDKVYLVMVGHDMKPLLMELKNYLASFSIQSICKEHEGSYYCFYKPQSGFFVSEPSDPMNLWVLAPQISVRPSNFARLESSITIRCSTKDGNAMVYLHKVGSLTTYYAINSNGKMVKVFINHLQQEHRGRYCCSLSRKVSTSLDACVLADLLVIDPTILRPQISMQPAENITLGAIVHLYCKTEERASRFYFQKSGQHTIPQLIKANRARIAITIGSQKQGGNYSCSYQTLSDEFSPSSELSEPVELLIRDPSLPRPEISIHPSRSVALGTEVKINCKTRNGPMRFYLHLTGRQTVRWAMKPDFDRAEFSIHNISWEYKGKYICSYAYLERPFLFSAFSDSVELLISDDELGNPSILIGASIAGLFVLFLLFGVILCYKRRCDDEPQPVSKNRGGEFRVLKPQRGAKPACYLTEQDIPMENLPLESGTPTQTKNVIYAELKQKSLDIQGEEELDDDTEACTYTTVMHRTRNQD